MTPAPLDARNRRTATRIVGAVLVFHGLLLVLAMWVLNMIMHPVPTAQTLTTRPPQVSAEPPQSVTVHALPASTPASDLPDWLVQAQRKDASAPWSVDAAGHVVWPRGQP